MNQDTIISPFDGLRLSLIYAEPDTSPKGIVQIAHGMCEHKERYIPLMEYLCGNGYAVVCNLLWIQIRAEDRQPRVPCLPR